MKHMKKWLCVLLAAMMLFGAFSVAASASPAANLVNNPVTQRLLRDFQRELEKLITLENITERDLKPLLDLASIGSMFGLDLSPLLRNIDIPIPVKNMLHSAGIMRFPIYERSYIWNFIFKYILFGWIWMPIVDRIR